jgi:hypothetical protein
MFDRMPGSSALATGVQACPTIVTNPQVNIFVECIHHVMMLYKYPVYAIIPLTFG